MENELLEMQRLISTGYNDGEIMRQLGLTRRLFYYYKDKIYKASAAIQARKAENILAWEQQLLKERLTRLFRLLEVKAGEPACRAGEAAACAEIGQEIAINILRLENEGLRVKQNIKYVINKAEQQTKGLVDIADSRSELEPATDDNDNQSSVDSTTPTTTTSTAADDETFRPSDEAVF